MPRHGALAAEGFRNDGELPVAASRGPAAGVARMLLAFVAQIQRDRMQPLQAFPHGFLDRVHHGPSPSAGACAGVAGFSCSSGRYLEIHQACASTKASISPMPPKSLKLTQTSVGK